MRSRGRNRRAVALSGSRHLLPRRPGLRVARPVRKSDEGRGASYRLPRNPAGPDRADRPRTLYPETRRRFGKRIRAEGVGLIRKPPPHDVRFCPASGVTGQSAKPACTAAAAPATRNSAVVRPALSERIRKYSELALTNSSTNCATAVLSSITITV